MRVGFDLHWSSSGEPAWMQDIIKNYDTVAQGSGAKVVLVLCNFRYQCLTRPDHHDRRLGRCSRRSLRLSRRS